MAEVARAAGASPFHFSRLYHALARETVFESLTRIRLQRAARRLCAEPNASVSEIGLAVGYATPSSFDKAFRGALGVSPSELRAAGPRRRDVLLEMLAARAKLEPARAALRLSRAPTFRTLPPQRIAYVREHGPYTEVAPIAWSKLRARIARSNVPITCTMALGAAHDDPVAVHEELLRYDAGVVCAPGERPPPGTHAAVLEGGVHAVFVHRGPYRYIEAAFDRIFRTWVARSGVRLRRAPCLEFTSMRQAPRPSATFSPSS